MAQVNTSGSWPPSGLADASQGVSTGYPAAPQPDVANNLLMVFNAVDQQIAGQDYAKILGTELKATAAPLPQGSGFESPAADITYTWSSGSLQGISDLTDNSVSLSIGDTFTQAAVDGGLVKWKPDASAQNDNLVFLVKDRHHGGVIENTVNLVSIDI